MSGRVMLVNPRKRSSRKSKSKSSKRRSRRRNPSTAITRRKSNPAPRRASRRKRNPIRALSGGAVDKIMQRQIKPAFVQASGAIGLDVLFGYVGSMLPPVLTAGAMRHVTKAVGAIALSVVAGNFVKNETANELAKGGLTVALYEAGREVVASTLPAVPLGFYSPGLVQPTLSYYSQSDRDVYGSFSGLGYFPKSGAGTGMNMFANADSSGWTNH